MANTNAAAEQMFAKSQKQAQAAQARAGGAAGSQSLAWVGGPGGGRGAGGNPGQPATWAGGAGGGRGKQGGPGFGERDTGVPANAEPAVPVPAETTVIPITGKPSNDDLRVKIRVPDKYLTIATVGTSDMVKTPLNDMGGIIFPYTPSISYGVKASYSEQTPLHSNFALQFFKSSSISEITINGKFTVENGDDAEVYLSTVLLLKSLMRMRSGGASSGDADSGAPPPVCRLDAYGDMMLKNIPVVISSFRVELPDGVDYFTYKGVFSGNNSVPTISTLAITCLPMYSRNEMQKFSVQNYVNNNYRGQGYI